MGDFIKELNIIDFLGMLLPGCVLLLLLSHENTIDFLWSGYFGVDCEIGIKITVLLVAGYTLGMLVHELGDVIEIELWCIPSLDPKTYAAKVVGAQRIFICLEEDQRQPSLKLKKISWRIIAAWMMVTTVLMGNLLFILSAHPWVWYIGYLLVSPIVLTIVWKESYIVPTLTIDEKGYVDIIRASYSMIESRMVEKGNYRKRLVLDGFHVMMRNLLIVLAIIQIRIYFFSDVQRSLYQKWSQYAQHCELCILGVLLLSLMMIRYGRYAYLEYKYLFEDYLLIRTQEKANDSKAHAQV